MRFFDVRLDMHHLSKILSFLILVLFVVELREIVNYRSSVSSASFFFFVSFFMFIFRACVIFCLVGLCSEAKMQRY